MADPDRLWISQKVETAGVKVTIWKDLEGKSLRVKSEKDKYRIISLMRGLLEKGKKSPSS